MIGWKFLFFSQSKGNHTPKIVPTESGNFWKNTTADFRRKGQEFETQIVKILKEAEANIS